MQGLVYNQQPEVDSLIVYTFSRVCVDTPVRTAASYSRIMVLPCSSSRRSVRYMTPLLLVLTLWLSASNVKAQQNSSDTEKIYKYTLRVALMLPEFHNGTSQKQWPYFMQMVVPAMSIALHEVRKTILPFHNITYVARDTRCSNPWAQILSVDMRYEYDSDVFFGPACEYAVAPTARFCDYWGVPLITAGALAQGFSKQYFRTITRVQGSYDKFAVVLLDFFKLHNWNTTMLLLDEPTNGEIKDCYFCMGGISWTLGTGNVPHEVEGFEETSLNADRIDEILEKVKMHARGKCCIIFRTKRMSCLS